MNPNTSDRTEWNQCIAEHLLALVFSNSQDLACFKIAEEILSEDCTVRLLALRANCDPTVGVFIRSIR